MLAVFAGFPRESIEFFKQLAANNNRDWFRAHKEVYERACRAPMQALVAELQPRFGKAKISRINRDVRFSRSRAPYKAYVAAGLGGHYISVSAEGLYVGAGFRRPNPVFLRRLRAAIDDSTAGRRLDAILRSLRLKGYEVSSHETLSSTPRGYAPDHPRIELLQVKDIAAGRLFGPASWLSRRNAFGRIYGVMADTAALVSWLEQYVTGRLERANTETGKRRRRTVPA